MVAVHILIFGEMAAFKIVPVHSNACENEKFFSWSYKKKKKNSANQNSPICVKTTDIKLLIHELPHDHF